MTGNLLVWPEGRKLYFMSRDLDGNVENKKTKAGEVYIEKSRKYYAQSVVYVGGNLYKIPLTTIAIVFEQKGEKPNKDDKVIEVFGDIKFDRQTDPQG